MRSSKPYAGSAGCALLLVLYSCGAPTPREETAPEAAAPAAPAAAAVPAEAFTEEAAAAGLDFVHWNGMSGELYYCEIMGGGGGLIDYDQDGDYDVYLNQGALLGPGKTLADALFPPSADKPLTDRLYRNDLETGTLRFTDVTEESGIVAAGYGFGTAVGDYDNDSWPDLYVSNWNAPNELWHNDGDGTFSDVTAAAGVGERRWSVAAAFFDFDRDGWLDLYVGNYLDFTISTHKECVNDLGMRDYCGPVSFQAVADTLYHNRGGGVDGRVTFEDVSAAAGLTLEAPSLGAAAADFNEDGWPDLYVANDEFPNNLLLNEGRGADGRVTFRDEALLRGAAVNTMGDTEAGMGVAVGDFDNDGDEDLFVAHLNQETNTLYANASGLFEDRTTEAGLAMASFDATGFGAGFVDYDHDGWLDLLVVNGAVQGLRTLLLAGDPFPFHQKNLLFRNTGDGRFTEVSAAAGAAFELSEASRAAVFGDLDNDGDTDVVVVNNSGPARLLVNQVGQDRAWLGLRLVGGEPRRDMLGAWVELLGPGRRQVRRVRTEGSYAAARDPRVVFGLGSEKDPAAVRVTWPDGTVEEWTDLPLGSYSTLTQGSGQPATR